MKVKLNINNYKVENIGNIKNHILSVTAGDENISFDIENLILNRKTKEINMTLDFKNKTLKYKISEINKEFFNKIIVLSLTNGDKEYNIMYQMEESTFILKIKYEKVV